jgi:hypothetical protein
MLANLLVSFCALNIPDDIREAKTTPTERTFQYAELTACKMLGEQTSFNMRMFRTLIEILKFFLYTYNLHNCNKTNLNFLSFPSSACSQYKHYWLVLYTDIIVIIRQSVILLVRNRLEFYSVLSYGPQISRSVTRSVMDI